MTNSTKRSIQFIVAPVLLVLLIWAIFGLTNLSTVLRGLGPGVALNWLGILITAFSLSVTFFLAVMAIEAFSHMSFLRDATDRYEVLISRLEVDETKFENAQNALDLYNTEMLSLIDLSLQSSDMPEHEKLRSSEKLQIARARLALAMLGPDDFSDIDNVTRHILVLAEHGRSSDLRFALGFLKKINAPEETYALASEMIRELKLRSESAASIT